MLLLLLLLLLACPFPPLAALLPISTPEQLLAAVVGFCHPVLPPMNRGEQRQ
jgi:hypothetical protein